MSLTSDQEGLQNSLLAFTHAVCGDLDSVCSYGLTIGESYVPFDSDDEDECDDEEESCTQAWVRVTSVSPLVGSESFDGDCAVSLRLELEVGVLRCFGIEDEGEAPKASDLLVAAMQSMDDMQTILDQALSTEVWLALFIGTWTPLGPLGGQYGGQWTFTVEV